jgi:tRNA(Ile)-lysidine synthase
MLSLVHKYINKFRLLSEEKPVVVGLSGGADSVALLCILSRLGYRCIAAHCNFHLRENEAERDATFARNFAKTLNIPFYQTGFDTRRYAEEKHISIEMAARELRYRWFEDLRRQTDAQAIAVAHHRDDNVETFLINLLRGAGVRGLIGMRPKNGYIVRPLLSVSREDLRAWLEEEQLTFVTDSSNLSDAYLRNFLRLNVLPLLEKLNPSVKENIARTSEHLAAAGFIYRAVVKKAQSTVMDKDNRISVSALLRFPAPATILYELLTPFHFSRQVTDDIWAALNKNVSGKTFYSPTHRLIKDRDNLLIAAMETETNRTYLINMEEGIWNGPVELSFGKLPVTESFRMEKDRSRAYFDYDKLHFPLILRTWQAGDWFVPFGMKGRKKLSDYFSDRKYSLADKEKAWLLCSGDSIIWIVGERADERFKIGKTTKYALSIKFLRNMLAHI